MGVLVDVVAVTTTQRRTLDVVGAGLFVGVLTQLILAVFRHLAPNLRGSDTASRDALLRRQQRFALPRAVLLELGVAAVALGLAAELVSDLRTADVVRVGWIAIAVGIGAHLAPVLRPVDGPAVPGEHQPPTVTGRIARGWWMHDASSPRGSPVSAYAREREPPQTVRNSQPPHRPPKSSGRRSDRNRGESR